MLSVSLPSPRILCKKIFEKAALRSYLINRCTFEIKDGKSCSRAIKPQMEAPITVMAAVALGCPPSVTSGIVRRFRCISSTTF